MIDDINARYPKSYAGFFVFGNSGDLKANVISNIKIDFVDIEELTVTGDNLYEFRKALPPVYVSTVNVTGSIAKYLDMGALGLASGMPETAGKEAAAYGRRSEIVYYRKATENGSSL